MGDGGQALVLNEWVIFLLLSICLSWKAHPIHAIVAQNLIFPVLLGQPFLKFNHIMIDCSTCAAKKSNSNLLATTPIYKHVKDKKSLLD